MDAVFAVVLLGVLAVWVPLRLMRCEVCAMPFSLPQAVYRVVSFEGSCRRCAQLPDTHAPQRVHPPVLGTQVPSPIVERHRRIRAAVGEMIRAELADARATHRAAGLS